ncbi:MAG: autoinducer binding domain-containing protein [Pseudomonadota bacterium]
MPKSADFNLEEHLFRIRSADRIQAILEYAKAGYMGLGIDRASYHLAGKLRSPTSATVQLLSYGFPKSFVEKYHDPEFRKHDPIPDIIMTHGQPMQHREALSVRRLTQAEQAFVAEAKAVDIMNGIGVPLFGRNLRNAYTSFGFNDPAFIEDEQILVDFMAIASLAHLQICNFLEKPIENKVTLSTRESEVIGHIARGYSGPFIAKIIKVSEATVNTYIRRIFAKLEVSDKVSAVIRSLEYGLLRY